MKKIFRHIHLWLSIPFGLIITLICFSGAMLVFEKEITETSNPQLYYVKEVGAKTLPLDELAKKAVTILPDSVHITGITIFSDPKRNYQINLSKPHRASMYINPYTGEIKGQYKRPPFFTTMFKMHRWMMGSARTKDGNIGWGKLLVGVSTLIFVIALISGVVIWWPKNKKALKHRFSIEVKKGWRRFWHDLHVTGGIYALVFLLAMALTGLTWSFQWYRNGFYTIFGVKSPKGSTHQPQKSKGNQEEEATCLQWQKVYEELATKNPEYRQITLSHGNASVSFDRFGNQRAADKYTFNEHNGEITAISMYKNSPNSGKIRGWIYSVHVGSWGGIITRILTFLSALFGASLPLTGYYLWIKRKFIRNKNI